MSPSMEIQHCWCRVGGAGEGARMLTMPVSTGLVPESRASFPLLQRFFQDVWSCCRGRSERVFGNAMFMTLMHLQEIRTHFLVLSRSDFVPIDRHQVNGALHGTTAVEKGLHLRSANGYPKFGEGGSF